MEERNQVNEIHTVQMTAEQYAEFEQLKAERDAKAKAEKVKQDRLTYEQLVDEQLATSLAELTELSLSLTSVKQRVYEAFHRVLEMKSELFGVKAGQRTHTFTNKEGTQRLTLGYNTTDSYRDTVDVGIEKVMLYLQSLAKDETSKQLVDVVTRLLSKDAKGTIKASRVIVLRKMANEIGNSEFIDGVKIIEDSYQPQLSKQFIRAEVKGSKNEWVSIPLGVTEAGDVVASLLSL